MLDLGDCSYSMYFEKKKIASNLYRIQQELLSAIRFAKSFTTIEKKVPKSQNQFFYNHIYLELVLP